jgi:hypothetical protein
MHRRDIDWVIVWLVASMGLTLALLVSSIIDIFGV